MSDARAVLLPAYVVTVLAALVLAADAAIRHEVVALLPWSGSSAGSLLASPVHLLRVDHLAPDWVRAPIVPVVVLTAVLGVVLVVLPALVRECVRTGTIASAGAGLFIGGMVANLASLWLTGRVINVFAVPLPMDAGHVAVVSVGDLAVGAGIASVALLLLASLVMPVPRPARARGVRS